jgi:hypothetical protein
MSKRALLKNYKGAEPIGGKKGVIQVGSPPFFLDRPVGGRPSLVTLMFLTEQWFRRKVAAGSEEHKKYSVSLTCKGNSINKSLKAFPGKLIPGLTWDCPPLDSNRSGLHAPSRFA